MNKPPLPPVSSKARARQRVQRELKALQVNAFNLPHRVCDHFLGERHTFGHRFFVGSIIILCGTAIAQIHIGFMVVDLVLEGGGYVIHAIGAIPVVEYVLHLKEKQL